MIKTIFQGIILGLVSGCIWAIIPGLHIADGMFWGLITGVGVALLLFVFEQLILRTGLIHSMELKITSLTFFGYIFAGISAAGLIGRWVVSAL